MPNNATRGARARASGRALGHRPTSTHRCARGAPKTGVVLGSRLGMPTPLATSLARAPRPPGLTFSTLTPMVATALLEPLFSQGGACPPRSAPKGRPPRGRAGFVAGENSHFLYTHTTIALLNQLACTSPTRVLRDPGKMTCLADFIGRASDLRLAHTSAKARHAGRACLPALRPGCGSPRAARARARGRRSIGADRGHQGSARLRRSLAHSRTMNLPTLRDGLFGSQEVPTWGD